MSKTISPEPFEWKDEYRVGVKAIDEHREKFFEIINKLKQVITRKDCKINVADIFFSLVHYAEHYLINEEIYLKESGYPGFSKHKESHNNFIARIIRFKEDYQNNKKEVCEDMYFFLENWLINHILHYDVEAVAWLKEKGLR
ncbi:MAG: bacteriohemerythrin [Bacteroidales bacterium]